MPFTEDLNTLLEKGKDLPTLPDLVLELRAALDDEMTSDRKIADIINRDPVITGKLLRLANSAAYSRGAEINSVQSAVQRVGLREVRGVCVVLAVVDSFTNGDGRLDLRQFWDHSAAVGRVAQLLCRRIGLDGAVGPDDVYVAGLLHDVGILLLDQFFPDQFKHNLETRTESDAPLWQVEKRVIDMDHGKVGGLLVQRWSLPESISRCVMGHHDPDNVPAEYAEACRVMRAAEGLCTSLGAGVNVEGPADADPFSILVDLGMPDNEVEAVLTEIEEVGVSVRGILPT